MGAEEGNRRINVERIYKANAKYLKSADAIYTGQKLVIPPLSAAIEKDNRVAAIFSSKGFEKVVSVGRRHLSGVEKVIKKRKNYKVREGDSLWRVAAECLGDGSRYEEIAELNSDILADEDVLVVGDVS